MVKLCLLVGGLYGFFGVALGAFGAHALKQRLSADLLAVWRTAVEYQLYHALALLLLAVLARQWPELSLKTTAACFVLGTLLFSGSLYVLALSGIRGFGAITPIGGLLLLAGWLSLVWAAIRI